MEPAGRTECILHDHGAGMLTLALPPLTCCTGTHPLKAWASGRRPELPSSGSRFLQHVQPFWGDAAVSVACSSYIVVCRYGSYSNEVARGQ